MPVYMLTCLGHLLCLRQMKTVKSRLIHCKTWTGRWSLTKFDLKQQIINPFRRIYRLFKHFTKGMYIGCKCKCYKYSPFTFKVLISCLNNKKYWLKTWSIKTTIWDHLFKLLFEGQCFIVGMRIWLSQVSWARKKMNLPWFVSRQRHWL